MAKRIVGMLMLISGIALIAASVYIMNRIEEGKMQIGSAQKTVDQGDSLFSLNPVTKEVGKGAITGPARKKIDAANREVAQYETLAKGLRIGGIVLLVLGAGVLIIGRKRSQS